MLKEQGWVFKFFKYYYDNGYGHGKNNHMFQASRGHHTFTISYNFFRSLIIP